MKAAKASKTRSLPGIIAIAASLLTACMHTSVTPPPTPTLSADGHQSSVHAEQTTTAVKQFGSDQTPSRRNAVRPADIAAHVFDHAVHEFLRDKVSGIGREIQPGDRGMGLAITDDEIYATCVAIPEDNLRQQLQDVHNATGDDAASQYAVRSAIKCLTDHGANYDGPGNLAEYDRRILLHIVGTALPSALLATGYYGEYGNEQAAIAEAARAKCFDELAGQPATSNNLSVRIGNDLRAAWKCPRYAEPTKNSPS